MFLTNTYPNESIDLAAPVQFQSTNNYYPAQRTPASPSGTAFPPLFTYAQPTFNHHLSSTVDDNSLLIQNPSLTWLLRRLHAHTPHSPPIESWSSFLSTSSCSSLWRYSRSDLWLFFNACRNKRTRQGLVCIFSCKKFAPGLFEKLFFCIERKIIVNPPYIYIYLSIYLCVCVCSSRREATRGMDNDRLCAFLFLLSLSLMCLYSFVWRFRSVCLCVCIKQSKSFWKQANEQPQ